MILATLLTCQLTVLAAADIAIDHDYFSGAAEILHYTFAEADDRDYDGLPDDWSRRKGTLFPNYVRGEIDRLRGEGDSNSLMFELNGGQAIYYSPVIKVDEFHSYVFRGSVRTENLNHDGALYSISFLNSKRQRIKRFLSQAVTGTHEGWVKLEMTRLNPPPGTRFAVIGCHVMQSRKMDIKGRVWFDNLWLGHLPRLKLISNFQAHFKDPYAPIEIEAEASGLLPGHQYRLSFEMQNNEQQSIATEDRPLKSPAKENELSATMPNLQHVLWKLPPQKYGYYSVYAKLLRDDEVILQKQTSFAVMNLTENRQEGEFGWSFPHGIGQVDVEEMANIAAQAGINWVKYPLWNTTDSDSRLAPAEVLELFQLIERKHIQTVGMLDEPPRHIRHQFAENWTGVSEVFSMSPSFWADSLESVIALYSSNVRVWQLGSDSDRSFVGLGRLPETLKNVKHELDRVGHHTVTGIHWNWETPLPDNIAVPQTFVTLGDNARQSPDEIYGKLKQLSDSSISRWMLLKPLNKSRNTFSERASHLIKQMVMAKIGKAQAIYANDVFDEEHGLLNPDGSPSPLFLPWRVAALALQDADFVGSLYLPSHSHNYCFAKDGKAIIFLWNDTPQREEIFLGANASRIDLWGNDQQLPMAGSPAKHVVEISSTPTILVNCSEPIARWRMAVQFEKARLRSEYGGHAEAIMLKNTFEQGVNGTVRLNIPHEWESEPSNWQLQIGAHEEQTLPMLVTLPPNASLGTKLLSLDFDIAADRPYQFRVYRPYQVGLGDVTIEVVDRKLPDGRLEIEQTITNHTDPIDILNFRCSLTIRGLKRENKIVTKLACGKDRKFYYFPNAESLKGQEVRLRAEQVLGRRVLNYHWKIGENWDKTSAAPAPSLR